MQSNNTNDSVYQMKVFTLTLLNVFNGPGFIVINSFFFYVKDGYFCTVDVLIECLLYDRPQERDLSKVPLSHTLPAELHTVQPDSHVIMGNVVVLCMSSRTENHLT